MILEKELESLFEEQSINVYPAVDLQQNNSLQLEDMEVESFIRFCAENSIKAAFCEYLLFSASPFLIDIEERYASQYGAPILEALANQIEEYNEKVLQEEDGKPLGLELCCPLNGVMISCLFLKTISQKKGFFSTRKMPS